MLQLVAMDLDGTLADFNLAIQPETIELLQRLQQEGVKLVITSGKPSVYLSGLLRQVSLRDIILVGDNGGVIYFNHEFPPLNPIVLEMTNAAKEEMELVKQAFGKEFGEKIWIQPNKVAFSLFGKGIDIQSVYDFCDRFFKEKQLKHLKYFKTGGALDIMPLNIDKGVALKLIQEELNIHLEDTAVIGDGNNDLPMFLRGKIRITFPKSANIFEKFVPKIVKDINSALKFLLDLIRFEKNTLIDSLM